MKLFNCIALLLFLLCLPALAVTIKITGEQTTDSDNEGEGFLAFYVDDVRYSSFNVNSGHCEFNGCLSENEPVVIDMTGLGHKDLIELPSGVSQRFNRICLEGGRNFLTISSGLYSGVNPTSSEFSHYLSGGIVDFSASKGQIINAGRLAGSSHPELAQCLGFKNAQNRTKHYAVHVGNGVYMSKLGAGTVVFSTLSKIFSLYFLDYPYLCQYKSPEDNYRMDYDPSSGGAAGTLAF